MTLRALFIIAGTVLTMDAHAADLIGPACVHDGDTLRVDARRNRDACIGGTSIRIKGIAAPELNEPNGIASREALKRIVEGKVVVCQPTGEKSGDRVIAYCTVEGRDVGEAMVRSGLARDCPRWSGGRYAAAEGAIGAPLSGTYPLPGYCEVRRR